MAEHKEGRPNRQPRVYKVYVFGREGGGIRTFG